MTTDTPTDPRARKPRAPFRRWLQFSIGSLLMLTFLTAVGTKLYLSRVEPRSVDCILKFEWDVDTGENIKWVAKLGSQTYPTPRIAGGKVFIGSNNGAGWLKRYPNTTDLGVLLCFDEETGEFLWQHSVTKLPSGRVNDWQLQGICSTPHVEGDRLWYATSRCEVVCLDTEGFRDGANDGPFRGEAVQAADEADVVWKFDMMATLRVFPHNMTVSHIVSAGNLIFVNTCNGVDESHINVPSPQAPNFLALNKHTGKVAWTDNSVGANLLHGGWASPTYAVLGGVPQVLFPGGDGWLYSFLPGGDGRGNSKLLWKFDCNPKTSKWLLGGRARRNNTTGAAVVHGGLVYIATGQDPEHGEGPGDVWCIDPTKRGDVSPELVFNQADPTKPVPHKRLQACDPAKGDFTRRNSNSAALWHYDKFDLNGDGTIQFNEEMHRSISRPAIQDGLLVVSDFSGLVHCLDAKTGRPHWTYDTLAAVWGSPLIVGKFVFVGDEDGDVAVLRLSPDPKVAMPGPANGSYNAREPLWEAFMGSSAYAAPTWHNGVLYIATKSHLYAIRRGANYKTKEKNKAPRK